MRTGFMVYALVFLFAPGTAFAQEDEKPPQCKGLGECIDEIRGLETDINLLNLLNGMNLTEKQAQVILREACLVKNHMESAGKGGTVQKEALKEELYVLQEIRDSLKKTGAVAEDLKEKHDTIYRGRVQTKWAWKMKPQAVKSVEESAMRVVKILTPAQREVLAVFKPCLVPPQDLKNPIRVGQAGHAGHMELFLERMRDLPDFSYANRLDEIVDDTLKVLEAHLGAMKGEERADFIRKIKGYVKQARAMSDVEFALQKSELAEAITPGDKADAIGEVLAKMGVTKYQLSGRVAQFILLPRVIPILEKRLARTKRTGSGTGEEGKTKKREARE